jgi:hypothetical protein
MKERKRQDVGMVKTEDRERAREREGEGALLWETE